MTTETRDYAREMCRALNGVVFDGDPDVVQPILDAACAAAVAAERAACAEVAEGFVDGDDAATVALLVEAIAAAIRARSAS